jgi:CobQ-like glutamine amidotransferase family enzyme
VAGQTVEAERIAERVSIALVYPELLGAYSDRGNAEALAARAVEHGLVPDVVTVHAPDPVPAGLDAYLLGGGESTDQARAAALLRSRAGDGLRRAVDSGRPVLAVGGAFQLLGRATVDEAGHRIEGLGLLDLQTWAGSPRLVGELVVRTRDGELLHGFEHHAGRTLLGPGLAPLGTVVKGAGNNGADGTDGVRYGGVIGTCLHGPVLARNPRLADRLLAAILAERGQALGATAPLPLHEAAELYLAGLEAALAGPSALGV